MTGFAACPCRCDACADADCDGSVCAPHPEGSWVVLTKHLPHPVPITFETQADAEQFVETLEWKGRLRVKQVPAGPPPFPVAPADPTRCTCVDPFAVCPTHG